MMKFLQLAARDEIFDAGFDLAQSWKNVNEGN